MEYILFANIISMVIGLFNSFLLPKYLSIDTYAIVKTYNLYITYANIFCFGYNEGMYLKYGGKNIETIDKKELSINFINFFYLEIATFLVVLTFSVVLNNFILGAFALGMFSLNIITYLKSLYQATGEFSEYGKALNYEKIGIFILNVVLMFILNSDSYLLYIAVQVIVEFFVGCYLLIKTKNQIKLPIILKYDRAVIKNNIQDGFILMIGNFSSSIFVGLDRWFVRLLLTNSHFAFYSFSASIESLINVFITPITISLYNVFCKGISQTKIKIMKNSIIIWGFLLIAVSFPIKWIVLNYIDKYKESLEVIYILLVAQPFYAVIKGIYVNIYKSEKKQNYYMKQMLIMIIIACLLNALFFFLQKSMISIAFATLITSVIWLIVCEYKNKYRFTLLEYFVIFLFCLVFLFCINLQNIIFGMIIYIIVCFTLSYFFLKDSFLFMKNLAIEKIKKICFKFQG